MYFKTQCHMPSGSRYRLWPIKEYGNLSRGIVSNILVKGSINAYHANCCEIVKLFNNSGILCKNIFYDYQIWFKKMPFELNFLHTRTFVIYCKSTTFMLLLLLLLLLLIMMMTVTVTVAVTVTMTMTMTIMKIIIDEEEEEKEAKRCGISRFGVVQADIYLWLSSHVYEKWLIRLLVLFCINAFAYLGVCSYINTCTSW